MTPEAGKNARKASIRNDVFKRTDTSTFAGGVKPLPRRSAKREGGNQA
jgi:hypothetical protein